jgi:hypothetical protein
MIIPIVEGCCHEEEVEDIVVEGLVQGLIEVEEYHEEGSEVEVEGLLLLLKLCREGVIVYWIECFLVLSEWGGFLVSLPGAVVENRQADIHVQAFKGGPLNPRYSFLLAASLLSLHIII